MYLIMVILQQIEHILVKPLSMSNARLNQVTENWQKYVVLLTFILQLLTGIFKIANWYIPVTSNLSCISS